MLRVSFRVFETNVRVDNGKQGSVSILPFL